jgi:hypothetical protein
MYTTLPPLRQFFLMALRNRLGGIHTIDSRNDIYVKLCLYIVELNYKTSELFIS